MNQNFVTSEQYLVSNDYALLIFSDYFKMVKSFLQHVTFKGFHNPEEVKVVKK